MTRLLLVFAFLSLSSLSLATVVNVGLKHQRFPGQHHSTFNPTLRDRIEKASREEPLPAAPRGPGCSRATPNNNAMGGNILPVGIYWMTVELGTPSQQFQAAVDSGSGDLIIPSTSCVGCHPENTGQYNPAASSTSVNVSCNDNTLTCRTCSNDQYNQCEFSNTYQTCNLTDPQDPCTVSGPLYRDEFALGGETGVNPFGAIDYQTANFQQFFVIDAVVGFIPYGSSYGSQSLFQTLVDDNKFDDIFAMCMEPNNGGVITLGGVDDRLRSGDFMYTPRTDSSYFEIYLSGFKVQNDDTVVSYPVSFGTSKFIVDSGTNVLLVRHSNFEHIKSGILQTMCVGDNADFPGVCDCGDFFDQVCYPYTPEQIAAFPTVTLVAKGEDEEVDLVMSGSDYVVQNGTTGEYCYGIKDTGAVGLDIIGDTTMQNYYVSFDQNNNRLGWADVDMDYCMKIKNSLTSEGRTMWKEIHQSN